MADNETAKLARPKDAIKLRHLHPDLRNVVLKAAELGGKFIIITTMRGREEQNRAYINGFSKARFGQSPHNFSPSLAVDLGPVDYPGIDADYIIIKDYMMRAANMLGVKIVWGGNWISIKDKPHFELADWKKRKKVLAA